MAVVIRTNLPDSITLVNQGNPASVYTKRYYVNLYLPNVTPISGLDDEKATILLRGEYLERTLDNSYISGIEDKTIMVFGLPFADHDNTHHEYARTTKQVGWYTNENWKRGYGEGSIIGESGDQPTTNDGTAAASFLATARNAVDVQRSNFYVYHNKVYYPYTKKNEGAKQLHIIALFDGVELEPEDPENHQSYESTPWPCDVFDLQGRRVAKNETPETLRRNNPGLPKGVYIFGHKKVTIK